MTTPADPAAEDPPRAFDSSRRLTGPNRWFDVPAVTLEPLSAAAAQPAAWAGWAARVRAVAALLGWPDPQPQVLQHPAGHAEALVFTAPEDTLLAATELNEWAWERAADGGGDARSAATAATPGTLAFPSLAAQGLVPAQPMADDSTVAARRIAALAAAERSPPLQRLRAAAAAHGLALIDDDGSVSLGAGCGSRTWPRAALPLPLDVPWAALHGVPTVLVTGSNGKTTTVRLLAAIARAAGRHPGLSSTEGVWIDGVARSGGDWAGPAGARAVLRDAAVDFAVLETARGGILRRGLAVRHADVAVVTNVSADHLGEYGIHSVDDIAHVKLVVARVLARPDTARPAGTGAGAATDASLRGPGTLVLNAADPVLMAAARALPWVTGVQRALFAADLDHPALRAHATAGGAVAGARDGRLWLQPRRDGGTAAASDARRDPAGACEPVAIDLGAIGAMPVALGGAAAYNVQNLLAAALAAHAAGLPVAAIRATLASFGARPADNPGRLERHAWRGATVLLDYAHNPDGLTQLLAVARALRDSQRAAQTAAQRAAQSEALKEALPEAGPGAGRIGLLLGQAGNRDDDAIAALARTAAAAGPDLVVVKELPAMRRGRAPGEIPALLQRALAEGGLPAARIRAGGDEPEAARALLAWARPGDVIVLPVHTATVRAALVAELMTPLRPDDPA